MHSFMKLLFLCRLEFCLLALLGRCRLLEVINSQETSGFLKIPFKRERRKERNQDKCFVLSIFTEHIIWILMSGDVQK